MKSRLSLLALLLVFAAAFAHAETEEFYLKNAPFPMPAVAAPTFPDRTFNIVDFGAVPDGHTLSTQAFEKAIAACAEAGGGHVVIPPGFWLTGPLVLRSRVDLHAERGALVQFTADHSQYPLLPTGGKSGFATQSPISGSNLRDVAITGEGIFDGAGESWRPVKRAKVTEAQWKALLRQGGATSHNDSIWWPSREARDGESYLASLAKAGGKPTLEQVLPARDFMRPKMVVISNSENVLIEGVTLRNSPSFVFNPSNCRNLLMRNVTVFNAYWAQNGDGIDLSACKGALLYRCNVSAGDDGICMKSSGKSKDADGALNHIVIAECTVYHAHGGFVIGSNTDGGMRYLWATRCTFIGTDIGVRVKSAPGRGGLVHDIYATDIVMKDIIGPAIGFETTYEDVKAGAKAKGIQKNADAKIPEFCNFTFRNIVCEGAASALSIGGLEEQPIHDILIENSRLVAKRGVIAEHAAKIVLKNCQLLPSGQPLVSTTDGSDVRFEN